MSMIGKVTSGLLIKVTTSSRSSLRESFGNQIRKKDSSLREAGPSPILALCPCFRRVYHSVF